MPEEIGFLSGHLAGKVHLAIFSIQVSIILDFAYMMWWFIQEYFSSYDPLRHLNHNAMSF